jgi:hypothetical protein
MKLERNSCALQFDTNSRILAPEQRIVLASNKKSFDRGGRTGRNIDAGGSAPSFSKAVFQALSLATGADDIDAIIGGALHSALTRL